ncbi:MAG: hypothetical protein ACOCTP_01870 [Roseicyclus sp.]
MTELVQEGAPDFRAFSLRTSDPVIAHRLGARLLSAIADLETRVKHDRHGPVTPDAGRIVRELVRKEAARTIADADVPTPDPDGLVLATHSFGLWRSANDHENALAM